MARCSSTSAATTRAASAGVGGHVYEGARVPSLKGKYVFGDFSRGEIYCIDIVSGANGVQGANPRLIGKCPSLSAIGEDAEGELYCCNVETGQILTIAPQ